MRCLRRATSLVGRHRALAGVESHDVSRAVEARPTSRSPSAGRARWSARAATPSGKRRRDGCLGCDAPDAPSHIARIPNAALGYELVMCNSCGRFMKERPRRGTSQLLVERAITAELDRAAELRGLRI